MPANKTILHDFPAMSNMILTILFNCTPKSFQISISYLIICFEKLNIVSSGFHFSFFLEDSVSIITIPNG